VPLKIVPRATLGTRAVGCRRLVYPIAPRLQTCTTRYCTEYCRQL